MSDRTPHRAIAPRFSNMADEGPSAPSRLKDKASMACLPCKTRRTKCEGEPCKNCIKHNTECVFDEEQDGRRKGALKRKLDTLEEDRDLLIQLVSTLREGSDRRVTVLLNLIRSNASLEEIRLCIEDQLKTNESSPELEEARAQVHQMQESEKRNNRRILDVKRLSDIPLFKVPAKPWTEVTDDNDFVSHLISLWFTWYHPYSNWIDRRLFIKDMQAGNLDCQYCSPFLVNIILAVACAYSDYDEIYANADDPSSKGMHFYDEAKRLYEKEEGEFALTTVQGLAAMWACAALMGKDRVGWIYQGQLAYAVKEFAKANPPVVPDADETKRVMSRAIDNAIWGMYNITTASSISYHKLPLFLAPRRPKLPVDHDDKSDKWIPYPSQADGIEAHTPCVFNAHCSLNMIVEDASRALFGNGGPPPLDEVEKIANDVHKRLGDWLADLPRCMRPGRSLLPQVLNLHMFYHTILMTIFGLLKKRQRESSGQVSIAETETQSLRLSSAREVARLMETQREEWGAERAPAGNIQWNSVALITLLEGGLDAAEGRQAFVELCIVQRALSRRWALGMGMLRAVQRTAQQMEVALPPETDALFADFEGQAWSEKDSDRLTTMYPNLVLSIRQTEPQRQNQT